MAEGDAAVELRRAASPEMHLRADLLVGLQLRRTVSPRSTTANYRLSIVVGQLLHPRLCASL